MGTAVALVVQRYGADVVGGAELHTRQVAEQLRHTLGWQVDVYTTTARDYRTWANSYEAGSSELAGVRLHRFNVRWQRAAFFGAFDRLVGPWLPRFRRRRGWRWLAVALEWLWILLQGPYCPDLLRQLAKDEARFDKIIFVTYLYYPTLAGVRRFAHKALLIPLAHEEAPFHFLIVQRMLQSVRGILANTKPEADLVRSRLGAAAAAMPIDLAGVGFDERLYLPLPLDQRRQQTATYLLYLGRISAGKGVGQLLDWFKQVRGEPGLGELRLILAGHHEPSVVIPAVDYVDYRGFVSDEEKLVLMRGALAVVNPSPNESLSLIVIEAMALNIPVLVNAHCEVLRYYTEEVATAFGFRDYQSFASVVHQVALTKWLEPAAQQQLETTRAWALRLFSWQQILAAFARQVQAGKAG